MIQVHAELSRTALEVARTKAELTSARMELARQAVVDPVTGLGNRLSLATHLDQVHSISERYDRSYCVAVGNVDAFSSYNAVYGTPAGDQVLRDVASALAIEARGADRVYRVGGAQFVILLPEQPLEGGTAAAERLGDVVSSLSIPHSGSAVGRVTMSVGLAGWSPGQRAGSADMVAQAERALAAAKVESRGCVVTATLTGLSPLSLGKRA